MPRRTSSPLGGRPSVENAETGDQKPERDEDHGDSAEPGKEFSEEQSVAVDRLRQEAAHGSPIELAVHRIEAERDGDDRDEEAEEADEGGEGILGQGEDA